ncbi:hypothetical protein PV327_005155 [Microctonus hyperodae]|uniref:Mutator-like transposase domain-containing protein n=1 Tax=Microctonus hyperodae TaxID=165561 RepID=A0AA39G144_MICHY|nr:hypothetical protein PV327_005155 [Microctonus hyperodae]
MSNDSKSVTFRWKGKIVTKKVYEKRVAQQKSGKRRKKEEVISTEGENRDSRDNHTSTDSENYKHEESMLMDGRRIVDLKTLGKQMWCVSCKQALSLDYIEKETRIGLASQLSVRCHNCLIINQVSTSKQRESQDKRTVRYDTNYKAVLGVLHTGIGWTHLCKMCACLNIPCLDFKTYKKYETEIGLAAEKVAKSSCADAAALERKLTLE